jgi:thioredoxin-like negative regulator of GroEL
VSKSQGFKNLFFGVVDCKDNGKLCKQEGISNNLELKTYELTSKVEAVLTFIKNLIEEFLSEDETIRKLKAPGKVFVFFKILKCKHCKGVLKYWPKIVEHFKGRTDIHVGSLDCNHHREICNKYQLERYPRFYLIVDGEFNEQFTDERSEENLISYCEKKSKN